MNGNQANRIPRIIPISGKLITWDDPAAIGINYRDLINLRPHGNHKKAVAGMTQINVQDPIATYIKIRSGFHFRKDFPSESHVLVEAWNTGLTACAIYENETAIPNQGSFTPTALFTPTTPTYIGRFSDAPGGNAAYCNGDYSLIWGGDELPVGSMIVYDPDGSYRYDYTDRVRNSNTEDAQCATIHEAAGGIDANTLLLLHFDGDVTDSGFLGTHTPVNSGVTFTSSGVFATGQDGDFEAGDPDFITVPDHADFDFSGGIFTVDCWIKVESLSERRIIFYQETDDDNYMNWYVGTNGRLEFKVVAAGVELLNAGNSFYTESSLISTGTWYHVALVENGDSWYMFVNGQLKATLTDTDRCADYTDVLNIGREVSAVTRYFDGKMEEFRISSVARWTSGFEPPTEPYGTSDAGYFYLGSVRPINGFKVYVKTANTETSTMIVYYWNGSAWTAATTLADGTASGGISLAQTGSVTFDSTVATSRVSFIDGIELYWYKVVIDVVSAGVLVSHATVSAPFQQVVDLWDGVTKPCISFMLWDNGSSKYKDYTYNVYEEIYDSLNDGTYADISEMTTSDYLVVGSLEPLTAITVSIPNGKGNTTANTDMFVYYWNGSAWVSVGTVDDKTSDKNKSFAKSGTVSWNHPGRENDFVQEIGQNLSLYYYKIQFDQALSVDTSLVYHIGLIPAQKDIKNYRFPMHGHNRLWLCADMESAPNKVVCSAQNTPDIWNGDDTAEYYFGGDDELTCGVNLFTQFGSNLYSLLVFFKANETWFLLGTNPGDYTPYQASTSIGCPAPQTLKAISVGPGGNIGGSRNACIFQSTSGIYLFEGRGFTPLHTDIKNIFDQRSSDKINQDMIDKSVGWFDPVENEYHWCYASGTSTTLNREMVLDLTKFEWFELDRTATKIIQAAIPVLDTTGNEYVYGCIDTGYMERLEYGQTFDGQDITCTMDFGDIALHEDNWMRETAVEKFSLLMVAKATTTNSVSLTHYRDTSTSGTSYTLSPTASGRRVASPVISADVNTASLHRFKLTMATDDEDYAFEPISLGVFYIPKRLHTKTPA